jgi:hypothetical protein
MMIVLIPGRHFLIDSFDRQPIELTMNGHWWKCVACVRRKRDR